MNKVIMGCFIVAALAVPTFVQAQDVASGNLAITGTVVSSISLTIENGGTIAVSGAGTPLASYALTSISKFGGTVPTGFTRTTAAGSWTLAATVGVRVDKANSGATGYTMRAQLLTAPAGSVAWTLGAVLLNATTLQTIPPVVTGFTTTEIYAFSIQIPDAVATATAIDNTIIFSAISG